MKGIEAGDWPAWLALAVTSGHLAWTIWDRFQAWSAKRSAGISLNRSLVEGEILVKLAWLHPQPHTNYQATVKLLSPSQARLSLALALWLDKSGGGFIAPPQRVFRTDGEPSRKLTIRLLPEEGTVEARFFVLDLAQVTEAFRIEVTVIDNATGRPVARIRQALAWMIS